MRRESDRASRIARFKRRCRNFIFQLLSRKSAFSYIDSGFCADLVLIVALDRFAFTDQRLLGISRQTRVDLQQDMQS